MSYRAVWEVVRNDPKMKKYLVPVIAGMVFIVVVVGCVTPYWFTGGAIYNSHVTQNVVGMNLGEYGWGSRSIYAREGQTIEVEIEIHEIKQGGLYACLTGSAWIGHPRKSLKINTVGKHTITLVAAKSGSYKLEFTPSGESDNAVEMMIGGQCDLKYSATWGVL